MALERRVTFVFGSLAGAVVLTLGTMFAYRLLLHDVPMEWAAPGLQARPVVEVEVSAPLRRANVADRRGLRLVIAFLRKMAHDPDGSFKTLMGKIKIGNFGSMKVKFANGAVERVVLFDEHVWVGGEYYFLGDVEKRFEVLIRQLGLSERE